MPQVRAWMCILGYWHVSQHDMHECAADMPSGSTAIAGQAV